MSQKKVVIRDLRELKASRAPKIEFVSAPTRRVTKSDVEGGKTALQLAKESLLAKRAKQAEDEALLLASLRDFERWMLDIALPHIAEIDAFVLELGGEYLGEEFAGARYGADVEVESAETAEVEEKPDAEEKMFTVGDELEEVRRKIDFYLNCGDPRVALPLEATEIAFWWSRRIFNREDLTVEMEGLVKDNVVFANRHGDIEVLGSRYSLHQRFDGLKEPQCTEAKSKIKDAIRAQANRIREEEEQAKAAKTREIRAKTAELLSPPQSDLPILDVLNEAKTGKCGALVSGGAIQFEVSPIDIRILDVTGAPEEGFRLLQSLEEKYPEHEIRVNRKALKGKNGGLAKASECPKISVPLVVSKNSDDARDWTNAAKFAWNTVRGAIERALEAQRRAAEGLTHDEFHGDELGKYRPNMDGFIFNELGANREVKQHSLTDSELVVERFETPNGDVRIRVVGYNPEFNDLLERQRCLSEAGFPEGDRFGECPHPIKLVLQRDFRMEPARKNGQPTNGKDRADANQAAS